MDEYHMLWKVLMEEVSGARWLGRQRVGWIDNMKISLSSPTGWQWSLCDNAQRLGPSWICRWIKLTSPHLVTVLFVSSSHAWMAYHRVRGRRAQLLMTRHRHRVNWFGGGCGRLWEWNLTFYDYPSLGEGESLGILYIIDTKMYIVFTLFIFFGSWIIIWILLYWPYSKYHYRSMNHVLVSEIIIMTQCFDLIK